MPPEKVPTRLPAALPQPDHLHHLLHPRRDGLAGHAVELGVQAEVLLGREVAVERGVLEDEPDVAAHGVAFGDDVVAGHQRGAAGGLDQRAEHVDRGRLARAVGPEEAEHLAARATSKSIPRTASISP